ncbi:MAG: CPBP family intramembrane metalloprotease [Candidatus Goldbacteria bacterium]|nr:CPBP family intramembrane metalloprotease [Candidatus Goldiibacteriota bacterium]
MDKKPKKLLYTILFVGELFLVFAAIIILTIKKQSFISIFNLHQTPNIFILFLIITVAFTIAISISFSVIKLHLFKDIKIVIEEIINSFNLNVFDIFIISLLAGVCEEILFRGVLQPMLGIWITSFIFILLHGYFNPFNWHMSVFGILMFCLSMIIGLIYIKYGLVAAIIFHIVYDFIAFSSFKKFIGNINAA